MQIDSSLLILSGFFSQNSWSVTVTKGMSLGRALLRRL